MSIVRAQSGVPVPPPPVRFAGATHNLSGHDKPWLSAEGLEAYLRTQPTPYLGRLPPELVALCPETPRTVLEDLDQLAEKLRRKPLNEGASLTCQLASKPVRLTCLGSGDSGKAFTLVPMPGILKRVLNILKKKDDAPFVFKIYYDTRIQAHLGNRNHGSWSENSSGVRYSHQPIKNKARYYCGNPDAGWMINERITPDMDPNTRPGVWMRELGIYSGDSENNVNGIVFEEGGIHQSGWRPMRD